MATKDFSEVEHIPFWFEALDDIGVKLTLSSNCPDEHRQAVLSVDNPHGSPLFIELEGYDSNMYMELNLEAIKGLHEKLGYAIDLLENRELA